MGKRTGFEGLLRATGRAIAAAERERKRQDRESAARARQAARHQRMAAAQTVRDQRSAEKQAKADYLESRQLEADDLNEEIADVLAGLRSVLIHTLSVDDRISFASLRPTGSFAPYLLPHHLHPSSPPNAPAVGVPTFWQKLVPGSGTRYQASLAKAGEDHRRDTESHQRSEAAKRAEAEKDRADYELRRQAFEADMADKNRQVDEFESDYYAKEPGAVVAYTGMLLDRSEYPESGFPQQFRVGYDPASAAMVVEYDLPTQAVVPTQQEYRYVKSKDVIEAKTRKAGEARQIYAQLIAEMALRTLHEIFEADQADAVSVLTFTGVVDTHDPATGREIRVPVLSVRATKEAFLAINLRKVDAVTCLKSLGANVSAKPDELLAVRPIVEFNMVDKRFVHQGDALSLLESRQNLLDLTPNEFEVLVANLFGKMGLETKLTRSSRDGGVDAVAFDSRPVLGGKVVIQAKRYKDTVGVSAVRDLYGTMLNEGANKGILVATSRFGGDAYQFSADKPIELIDGSGLLYLLREHAGIEACIATQ